MTYLKIVGGVMGTTIALLGVIVLLGRVIEWVALNLGEGWFIVTIILFFAFVISNIFYFINR